MPSALRNTSPRLAARVPIIVTTRCSTQSRTKPTIGQPPGRKPFFASGNNENKPTMYAADATKKTRIVKPQFAAYRAFSVATATPLRRVEGYAQIIAIAAMSMLTMGIGMYARNPSPQDDPPVDGTGGEGVYPGGTAPR